MLLDGTPPNSLTVIIFIGKESGKKEPPGCKGLSSEPEGRGHWPVVAPFSPVVLGSVD